MTFQMAYDDALVVGREAVFVVSDDWHQKVRVMITGMNEEGGERVFAGHSYGSSVRGIKAAKKDETPVCVQGRLALNDGVWAGSVENA